MLHLSMSSFASKELSFLAFGPRQVRFRAPRCHATPHPSFSQSLPIVKFSSPFASRCPHIWVHLNFEFFQGRSEFWDAGSTDRDLLPSTNPLFVPAINPRTRDCLGQFHSRVIFHVCICTCNTFNQLLWNSQLLLVLFHPINHVKFPHFSPHSNLLFFFKSCSLGPKNMGILRNCLVGIQNQGKKVGMKIGQVFEEFRPKSGGFRSTIGCAERSKGA